MSICEACMGHVAPGKACYACGTVGELPPAGTIIMAMTDVHDDASDRRVPQHAKTGDFGVVEGYNCGDEIPTINWGKGSGFGVYDTPWHQLARVSCMFDFIEPGTVTGLVCPCPKCSPQVVS